MAAVVYEPPQWEAQNLRLSVGYAKRDLMIPAGGWPNTDLANEAARAWCAEVNGVVHSEIAAVPEIRLSTERSVLRPLPSLRLAIAPTASRKVDRLRTVRYASARYSVPGAYIGTASISRSSAVSSSSRTGRVRSPATGSLARAS